MPHTDKALAETPAKERMRHHATHAASAKPRASMLLIINGAAANGEHARQAHAQDMPNHWH
eukprot:15366098-Alexandrium_andersonii.AAC.1